MPFLKRFLNITGYILDAIFLILLVLVLLVQTEWAQNQIIGLVTKRLSRDLNTEVSIKQIQLGFFNKLNLEGTLVRDQQKDTLLYAGRLKLEITDWFFIKNDVELTHMAIKYAIIERPEDVAYEA
jgi:hypothetical protein